MKQEKTQPGRPPTLTVLSPAKINLTLDVLGIDPDPANTHGYHFVDTIMHEIGLADELTFTLLDEDKIIIESDNPTLPTGEKNTIFKAIKLLEPLKQAKKQQSAGGIKVEIKKNIPLSSGLGGGSSNAATTLKALNQLWNLGLSSARLRVLAAKIGMDTPFFIEGGTAHCTHYGEKVQLLPTVKLPPHLIVMDDKKSSTKEMYAALDSSTSNANPPPTLLFSTSEARTPPTLLLSTSEARSSSEVSDALCASLCSTEVPVALCKAVTPPSTSEVRSSSEVCDSLCKDTIFNKLQSQKTRALQKKLLQLGATVVHTCGSGPALYALFESEMIKRKVYKELKGHVGFIWQNQNKN